MRLVYDKSGRNVSLCDKIVFQDEVVTVVYAPKPHSPASSGKVTVEYSNGDRVEYYAQVFGMTWIEREDRGEQNAS